MVGLFRISPTSFFCVLLFCASPTFAQNQRSESLEGILSKGYYYLLSYTRWPNIDALGEIRVCINPRHDLHQELAGFLQQRKIGERRVVVQPLYQADEETLKRCNVVILESERPLNTKIIQITTGAPILTVSSDDDITEYGGIAFITRASELKPPKFNLLAIKASKLQVGAALLDYSEKYWQRN